MNGVVGMAELLGDTQLDSEQRLYVDTIKNSGEALLVIINDVLDYSKIEAEKLVLHAEPFDLERCIHEVVMLVQPTARDKGLDMLVDYDLFLPTRFVGDPGRVRQVLTNLIGNAVKFTLSGHVLIRVTGVPGEDAAACTVHVTIEDTGIGIPADKVEHIFGEFNQVEDDRNRQFEGTGLGLAISRRLIGLMGGDVWVESEAGKGSCFGFRVRLPVSGGEATAPCLPETLRHVLVVDDQPINRQILERQMQQLGIRVTCCASGAEALAGISDSIDLVLSDHNMPGMDGLELAEALHRDRPDLPVLLLSSNPGSTQSDPAFGHIRAVLPRPVSRAMLNARLADMGVATENPEPPALPEPAPDAPEPAPEARRMKILAAEDNRTNQLVFRKMAQGLDIDLRFANNGIEAVAGFSEFAPDMIFMDISMPKMDGKQATGEIRKLEAGTGGHVPIVALTAHAMDGDGEAILAAGLDHYLTKPLRKALIHEAIVRHCPAEARPVAAMDAAETAS